jgi:hypothetical protein
MAVLPLALPGDIPVAFLGEMVRPDKRQQQNNYMVKKYD